MRNSQDYGYVIAVLLGDKIQGGFTWVLRCSYSPSLKRNRIKSVFSTVGILMKRIFDMKKRTAFIGAILSLMPLGQPFLIKTSIALVTAKIVIFNSDWAIAESAEFYFKLGNQKLDSEDYKGAISDYTKAIKINPKDGDAYRERGYSKSVLEDDKGAISDYTKAIKINPKDGDAYRERGYSKSVLEDDKGAISDYTKAIGINPKDGDAYRERGYSKVNLNDYEGALSDYTKAIKINPEDGEGYMGRFRAKLFSGDFKGAVSDRNKAFAVFSKDKSQLSVKDIVSSKMLAKRTDMWKVFSQSAGFNGKTYEKPITYYIHDENSKNISKHLPKAMRNSYEISDDEEQFTVDIFSYIDSIIDLDFVRVNSKSKAMISIYKTDKDGKKDEKAENGSGVMQEPPRGVKYKIEVAWAESPLIDPKLKKYPTLSIDNAFTIAHEIGHALGLNHKDPGCLPECSKSFDPEDIRFNNRDSVMSYNNFLYPKVDTFFTELDIKALRTIWGIEKGN